jgi:NDP-sugar pyrophosphorylase family protein
LQAVVLAGGLGTRLRPITERIPKPMVEVAGRPFLETIIRHLADQEFRRILLLLGYLGERIVDHFGDGRSCGVKLDYAWEKSPLGTGGAVRNALDELEEDFLLLYGDSYLPIDYRPVAAALRQSGALGLIVVYDNGRGDTGVPENVATDAQGWVTRYAKGEGGADLRYVEAGVLAFRREVFARLPAGRVIALEQEIYPKLIAERQLFSFVSGQRFYDIGTPERLEEFVASRR